MAPFQGYDCVVVYRARSNGLGSGLTALCPRKAVPPRWGCSLHSQSSALLPSSLVQLFLPGLVQFPISTFSFSLFSSGLVQLSTFSHLLHPKSAQHTDKLRMIALGKGVDDSYSSPDESRLQILCQEKATVVICRNSHDQCIPDLQLMVSDKIQC